MNSIGKQTKTALQIAVKYFLAYGTAAEGVAFNSKLNLYVLTVISHTANQKNIGFAAVIKMDAG